MSFHLHHPKHNIRHYLIVEEDQHQWHKYHQRQVQPLWRYLPQVAVCPEKPKDDYNRHQERYHSQEHLSENGNLCALIDFVPDDVVGGLG
mmetsp:Transcript_44378/g.32433  ORF Transcript_44378/g.32433 Transcript_44378/m.32433 type:complete len:90 (-) Transcript_44378:1367-1636(-)